MSFGRGQLARFVFAATVLAIPSFTTLAQAGEPSALTAGDEPGGEDSVAKALARYKRGQELYTERNFPAALIEFRKAYEIAPNYRVLYNIGQVCYQMQDYVCALQSLEQYLVEGGSDVTLDRRQAVQGEIGALKQRIGYLDVRTNVEGAEITVDDVVAGTSPLKAPITVSAGRHKVVVISQGRAPVTRSVDVAGQDTAKLDISLSDLSRPTDPSLQSAPTDRPSRGMTTLSWVGYGIGAGLLAGGAVTGALALGSADDVKSNVYPNASDADSDKSRTTTFAALSDGLLIAGAATVVITTIFTFVIPHGGSKSARARAPFFTF